MPPRRFSRYSFTSAILDSEDRLFLTAPQAFRFQNLSDNRRHVVSEGDTLFTLAFKFFKPLPRPAGLWWVIADFQPEPVFDPTLALEPGRVMFIPSIRTVIEDVFNDSRLEEAIP